MKCRHQQQMDYVIKMKNKPRVNVSEKKVYRLIQEIWLNKFIS